MGESTRCEHVVDAVAFVQDELPAAEREAFALHLQGCATCFAAVRSARALIGGLRTLSDDDWQVRARRRPSPAAPLALAAGLLLAVTGSLAVLLDAPRATSPEADGTAGVADESDSSRRLSAGLLADGTWREVERVSPTRRASLHALALLALARGEGTHDELLRAGRWLLQQQDDVGVVGGGLQDGSTDQVLATLALAEAARATGDPELREGARAAGRALVDGAGRQRLHPAQVAWADEALEAAFLLDVQGVERARMRLVLDRGAGDPARVASARRGPAGEDARASLGDLHATCAAVLAAAD